MSTSTVNNETPRKTDSRLIGRVIGLWRYPVKSMGPEALEGVDVSWFGVAGDRRWAFVRNNAAHNGFPWLTLRDIPNMNQYIPAFTDPDRPDASPTTIRTPSGNVFDVTDPALAAELHPKGASVMRQSRGVFDTFPLSIITQQTIDLLGASLDITLETQRFRPNILIDAESKSEFPEDEWVGRELRIGSLSLRADKRDGRCTVITLSPTTAERKPEILKTVIDERQGCLGIYGTTVNPGGISVGDEVFLC